MISMALAMCVVLACEAITVAIGGESAGIAAVFFVFIFEGCFSWGKVVIASIVETLVDITSIGWMTSTWVYPAEILPLRLRAKGPL